MSENLQKLLKEAFLNNSFDYDSMDISLNNTWINSYSYLYTLQKSHVQYEELFFYSNDEVSRNSKHIGHLYLDKSLYANFDVDYDLIDVCNREEYRRSEYYYAPYSFEEMCNTKTIFTKIPIVMIDDRCIFDYKLISKNDNTDFILPFRRNFVIDDKRKTDNDDITYIDHKIQVLIVDNRYYERISVNKNTIDFNAITKTFTIPKSLLHINEKLPKKGTMFCSIHIPNAVGKGYELGTVMIPLELTEDSYVAKDLTDDLNVLLHNTTSNFYISLVFVNRLIPHNFYFGGNKVIVDENGKTSLMVVQKDELVPYEMPIPVEDFMIFKKSSTEDGYKLVKNTEMLNMYYPNIYAFKDSEASTGDSYKVYYFYYDGDNYKYTVLFDFYYRFLLDAFAGYSFEAIIDGIYNDKFDYSTIEYFSINNLIEKYYEEYDNIARHKGLEYVLVDTSVPTTKLETRWFNIEIVKDIATGDEYDFRSLLLGVDTRSYAELYERDLFNMGERYKVGRIVDQDDNILYDFEEVSFVPEYIDESERQQYFETMVVKKFKETFEKIINYQYYNHLYGETDFLHRYLMVPGNEDKAPIEYKDETLRDWMKVEPWVLRDYVLEQKKLGDSYHLFTNTINLPSRLRYDTSPEMGSKTGIFSEPRYVFAMSNTRPYPVLLDCRVYVDGLLVSDLYQERKAFMDYLYIPCNMVTDDSYIEIEVFPSYMHKENMTFNAVGDEKKVVLPTYDEVIFPTLADIYYTSPELPNVRIGEENFDYIVHCDDRYGDRGDFEAVTDDEDKPLEFVRVNEFTIRLANPALANIPLEMRFNKNSIRSYIRISENGYPHFKFYEKNWNFSTEYLRVFRNGRLLPRCKYQFNSGNGQPRLMLLDYYHKGEMITIDIAPYRYHEIYYQEELSPDNTLIDLRKIINKPFDIRYYDVYMNGRRLSLNNVFSITPWEITLVNLKSSYNLEIFEKERDWEYFGLDYTQNIYYFTIDDLFDTGFITTDEKNKMIRDIIDNSKDPRLNIYPNTNEEEKQDRTDLRKFVQFAIYYHDQLIPHTYINPDILEENYELMQEDYFYVLNEYMRRSRDSALNVTELQRKYHYPKVIMHDPDIMYSEGNPNNRFVVYPLGHLENKLPDEYKDQIPVFINGSDLMHY